VGGQGDVPYKLTRGCTFTSLAIQPAVPVELLAKLGVLLGKNWQKALQVVDQNEVQCYQAEPSGRRIFEVRQG
jgi:hypothetical protein